MHAFVALITNCDVGYESINGSCEACQHGFYKPDRGVHQCTRCPGNNLTLHVASTSLADCLYGETHLYVFVVP